MIPRAHYDIGRGLVQHLETEWANDKMKRKHGTPADNFQVWPQSDHIEVRCLTVTAAAWQRIVLLSRWGGVPVRMTGPGQSSPSVRKQTELG